MVEMTDPSLALQRAIRAVLADQIPPLVAASAIFDKSIQPDVFPSIIIGDGQVVPERIAYDKTVYRVFFDLDVWTAENNLASVKKISGPVCDALLLQAIAPAGFNVIDVKPATEKFMRDPGTEHSRAIISAEYLMEKV